MRYILPNKQVIQGDAPFVLGDVQYEGANKLTPDERKKLGITEVIEQPYPTDDFVFVTEDPNKPGAWITTPFSPERIQDELCSYAKNARWNREQRGTTVNGIKLATDDRSKILLLGASSFAANDPTYVTKFDSVDGTIVTLNAAQIQAVTQAVAAYVDQGFKIFADVSAKIKEGTITTKAQIDQAFA